MAKQKLFTKSIDDMLFAQYKFGSDFDKQKVVCKIFNPYGDGTWFIMNSDPNDPDYLWAIVKMFGNVEVGSVSRSELESISFFGMNIGLERDISFSPTNAMEVYNGLLEGKHYANGGETTLFDDFMRAYKQDYDDMNGYLATFSSIEQAKQFALDNRKKYDVIVFLDAYGDSIHVAYDDTKEDIDFLFSTEYAKGGGVGETTQVYGKYVNNNTDSPFQFSSNSKGLDFLSNHKNIDVLSIGQGKYDLFYGWDNNKQEDGQLYFGKWNKGNFGFNYSGSIKYAKGGGVDNGLELLKNKIIAISKKMVYDGESGYGGFVVYLGGDEIQIFNYSNLSPYSAQATDKEIKVSFNAPNQTMVVFSNTVDERFEDNKSFEKYGGIKYIYEPLTNKIASEILDKVFLDRYAKGGKIGFKGLASKVAARYKGTKVPAKYQKEYGKTYDAAEAQEVGNKVAAKVYRQQLAKKKFADGGEIEGKVVAMYQGYEIYDKGENTKDKFRFYMRDKNVYHPYTIGAIVANGNSIKQTIYDFDPTSTHDVEYINTNKKYKPNRITDNIFALGGNTSDKPKIYVEELIAHNEGLDDGEWIILTDYDDGDEIMDAINDLLIEWSEKYGEERDEYIVSAYENFDDEYYDKFMDETQFDEILEAYNKGGNLQEISDEKDIPVEVLEQIISDFDPDNLSEWIDDNYYGYFDSERELAEEYVSSIGGLSQLSESTLESHFDYDGFGSDLASDYSEYDGYYFRNYKRGGVMPKHDLNKYLKKKVSSH